MKTSRPDSRVIRAAVIGAGPAGFFTAAALRGSDHEIHVDIFESLPAPYGLVRYGVAPDHQNTKRVIRKFTEIAEDEKINFFGNVHVGRDISVDELRLHYDILVFANGLSKPRRLGIPGEDLPGSHAALDLVGWYNGNPGLRDQQFNFGAESVVVIGHGNVSLDVVRILGKSVDELRTSDIPDYALDQLAESKIRTIYLVGRRGPAQAAFTYKEVNELTAIGDCGVSVDSRELALNQASEEELEAPGSGQQKRIVQLFHDISQAETRSKPKRIVIQFRRSPKQISGAGKVETITLEKNRLTGDAARQRSEGTGEIEELACAMVFGSIGYVGEEIPGVPFDANRGIVRNKDGRILANGEPLPGCYVSGWIKRGSKGLIGVNKKESMLTVHKIIEDIPEITPCPYPSTEELLKKLAARNIRIITFTDWQKLDLIEVERGISLNKPREKFCSLAEMLPHL